jgi:hypothetical protein
MKLKDGTLLALTAETVETLRFVTAARMDKLGLRRRVLAGAGRIWRFANIALIFIKLMGGYSKTNIDAVGSLW